jgi:hypothetical protein
MRRTSRTPILLAIEDLQQNGVFRLHPFLVIPAMSFVGPDAPGLKVLALGHVLESVGFGRWQKCGASDEIVLTDSPGVTHGEWITRDFVMNAEMLSADCHKVRGVRVELTAAIC